MENYRYIVPRMLQPPVKDLYKQGGWSPALVKEKGEARAVISSPKKKATEKLHPFIAANGEQHPLCYVWVDMDQNSDPPQFGSREQIALAQEGSKHGMIVFYPPAGETGINTTPIELGSPAASRAIRSLFDTIESPEADADKKKSKRRPLTFIEKLQLVNCTLEFFQSDPNIVGTLNDLGFQYDSSELVPILDQDLLSKLTQIIEPKLMKSGKIRYSQSSPEAKQLLKHLDKAQKQEYQKVSPISSQKKQGYISYLQTVSFGPDVFGEDAALKAQELYDKLQKKDVTLRKKGQETTLDDWKDAAQVVKSLAKGEYKKWNGRMPSVTAPYNNETGELLRQTNDRRDCNIYGMIPGNKIALNKKGSACRRNNMGKYTSKRAFEPDSRGNIVERLYGPLRKIKDLNEYKAARGEISKGLLEAKTKEIYDKFTGRMGQPSSFYDLLENGDEVRRDKKISPIFSRDNIRQRQVFGSAPSRREGYAPLVSPSRNRNMEIDSRTKRQRSPRSPSPAAASESSEEDSKQEPLLGRSRSRSQTVVDPILPLNRKNDSRAKTVFLPMGEEEDSVLPGKVGKLQRRRSARQKYVSDKSVFGEKTTPRQRTAVSAFGRPISAVSAVA